MSAFDIIFDRTLTVTQNGVERELTVDEALQHQTYQAALKGSKMAIRSVLKMIEKRELALQKVAPKPHVKPSPIQVEYESNSADEAMLLLGILKEEEPPPGWGREPKRKLDTWAVQAALSRPGRRRLTENDMENCRVMTINPEKIRWPRSRG